MLKNMKNLVIGIVVLCVLAMSQVVVFAAPPTFSLAWSEYPSWSVFGVAGMTKVGGKLLIDGHPGKLGIIEEKWGVDIVLKEMDYDGCIVAYGAGQCDASCITNMDILNPALSRKTVSILPTSTSFGADACIVTPAIKSVTDLKGKKVFGLAKSVSEYVFVRNLVLLNQKESDYTFTNMDPGAAATAMQQKQTGFEAIMVWNPFVKETLNKRKDCKVLFDSTTIPGEIIDMVMMSEDSLSKPGGKEAACAIIDTYYTICKRLADSKLQDDTLVALGEKFSHLDVVAMRDVVRQTRFYATPEQGTALLTGGVAFPWKKSVQNTSTLFTNEGFNPKSAEVTTKTLKEIMLIVVDFCVKHEIIPQKPAIGYGTKEQAPDTQLKFDPTYIKMVAERK